MQITNKKWIRWVFGMLCVGALLLAAVAIALPNLVRLSSVHKKIETYLAGQLQGQLTYENMALAYFPRPCFRIQNVSLSIPHKLTGSVDYVNATPSLLSLLVGQIRIAGIDAANPNCKIELASLKGRPAFQFEEMNRIIANAENLPSALKGLLKVTFQDGRVAVTQSGTPVFSFQNIHGTYRQSPSSVKLKVSGSGDLWKKADVNIRFNFAKQFGEGSIGLKGFKPHYLTTHLWPDAAIRIIDSNTDALCDFTFNTTGHLNLSLKTNKPVLTLQKGEDSLELQGNAVSGAILLSKDQTKFSIANADLTYPELKVDAHFLVDKTRPHAEWVIQAKDIDVPSLRRTSDFTVGNFKIARILSNVIRDGYVSEFSIQDQADDVAGLARVKNLKLHGLIENGYIFVPGAALHLKDVKGDVSAAKGMLTAKPITARLGNSVGKNGFFSLYIGRGDVRPFLVDCDVEADLKELPLVLKQLIPNAVFKQEMANITSATGNALGKLVIKRTKQNLDVEVDVSSFDLKGTYNRIPFPLSLKGGKFIYRDGNIQLQNIDGRIGASTLSKFNATLEWKKEFTLTIPSGRSTIDTDEVYPWLLSYSNVRDAVKYLQTINGKMVIEKMAFKGPLFTPKDWQFSFATKADNLHVGLPLFEEPILCYGGRIIIEPNILYFDNTHVSVLDADAKMTGAFSGYIEDKRLLDAYFHGDMGKDMSHWIQEATGVPNDCKWQTPLSVSNMHLVWQESGGFKVALQAHLAEALSLNMDLSNTNNELLIKHLSIQDGHSKADMCIFRGKKITDVEFNGKLTATTLDRLLIKNTFLSGAIQGDCHARIIEAAPHKSTVYGKLHINGLQFYRFNWPLQVEQLSIEGAHQRIDIAQARLIWEDSLVFLSGSAAQYDQGLQLNGKLIADRLDWQQIENTFLLNKAGRGHVWPVDIYGTLKVSSGTFRYSDTMALGPFESTLHFNKNALAATLEKAELCGISIPGRITMSPTQKTLSLTPTARYQNLALPFACIGDDNVFMDGRFSIDSNLNANIEENTALGPACRGDVIFTAKDGRIYRFSLLAKIFTLLNVAGLVAGDFPDLEKEGFPYKKATVKGIFENGVLKLKEGVIDSPAMKIFFHGKENYLEKKHDMTIVVAPLKTVDMVVEKIPVVKEVLNKGFVIYPVKVTGSWENPKLQPVSTEAVGMEILGIIGRTLNLPATLLKKVLPSEK